MLPFLWVKKSNKVANFYKLQIDSSVKSLFGHELFVMLLSSVVAIGAAVILTVIGVVIVVSSQVSTDMCSWYVDMKY